MTAASNAWPLGTRLRVCAGGCVEVAVTDRCGSLHAGPVVRGVRRPGPAQPGRAGGDGGGEAVTLIEEFYARQKHTCGTTSRRSAMCDGCWKVIMFERTEAFLAQEMAIERARAIIIGEYLHMRSLE